MSNPSDSFGHPESDPVAAGLYFVQARNAIKEGTFPAFVSKFMLGEFLFFTANLYVSVMLGFFVNKLWPSFPKRCGSGSAFTKLDSKLERWQTLGINLGPWRSGVI